MGSRPMTRSASISSRIFMEPISAVKAEPERPATMIEVRSTREFAQDEDAGKVDDEGAWRRTSASWKMPCWATMQPTRNEIRTMIGTPR